MIPPHEPPGRSPLGSWLKRLLRYVIANEIKPGVNYKVRRTSAGTILDIKPSSGGGASVSMYKLDSVQGDYITCHLWDGTTEGTDPIYIAKPYRLRESLTTESGGISGGGYDFSYSGSAPNRVRLKDDGTDSEYEVVIPIWLVDEVIYAIQATTGVNDGDGNPITLLMLSDGRAWAKATS